MGNLQIAIPAFSFFFLFIFPTMTEWFLLEGKHLTKSAQSQKVSNQTPLQKTSYDSPLLTKK